MALKKIQDADLAGKGVTPLADVPGLPAAEMKAKFEEIVREVVIPAVNAHAENAYDKTEVEAKIATAVLEAGAADMAKAVYDPRGKKADAFSAANVDLAGYSKAGAAAAITAGDSVRTAVGKLETATDGKLAATAYDPDGEVAAAGGIPAYAVPKTGLAQDTGSAAGNAMSQRAVTEALAGKVDAGKVGEQIFTGAWTTGAITREQFRSYKLFAIATNLGDGVATLLGNNFRFTGNYATADRITAVSLDATLNGDTLTWKNGFGIQLLPSATPSAKQTLTVAAIYGIV